MTVNPWQAKHRDDERVFSEHLPPEISNAIVDGEYAHLTRKEAAGVPHTGCGGTYFYKATVGVFKCTRCGELARIWWEDAEETPFIEVI